MKFDTLGLFFLFVVISMMYFLMYVLTTPNGMFSPKEVFVLYLSTSSLLVFIALVKRITDKGL